MTTPPVCRRRRQLGVKVVADGPSQQYSSAITCEDNSRSHSNFVWANRPRADPMRGLLRCTADRPVRETLANLESIVRVAGALPRCVADRVVSSVENLPLFRDQIPAWR